MGATSLDLSQIKTDALSAASTFRTLIGLGNVNNTSDANKPISTATQTALDLKADSSSLASYLLSATAASTYLPLAGGTLTGPITGTSQTVEFRNSTNAQTFRLYGTYTDASNYRRLYLSSTTAGAFTLGVEGAGTGASGNTLTVPNVLYVTDKIVHRNTNTGYDLVRLTSSGGEGVINIGNTTSATTAILYTSVQSNILNIAVQSNIFLYANNGMTFLNSAGTARSAVNAGIVNFAQPVSTSGSPTAFTLTGAAHTTLTASTEATDVNFNLARTLQFATGALTTQRAFRIQAPTYSFVGASTITTASTLSISGAPVAGTNATITNAYALNVENGALGVGISGTDYGRIIIQDSGQYSSNSAIRVHLGGIFLGQNISVFTVSHNGNVYARGALSIDGQNGSITTPNINFEGGWGSIARAVITPQGNGNIFSNVYGLQIACGTNYGLMVTGSNSNIQLYNTYTDASNYIRQALSFTTYSGTVYARIAAEGAGTGAVNIPFVITPRGTGAFILGPMPDGTSTGGNARGQNAVDLQAIKTAASQVASGRYSFVVGYANTASGEGSGAGGYNTSASGFGAFSWGNGCTTSGLYGITLGQNLTAAGYCSAAFGRANSATEQHALALGHYTTAWVQGMIAFGSGGRYSNPVAGDQQGAILPMLGWSCGSSAIELLANATNRLTVPTRCAFGFTAEVFGVKNKAGQAAFFIRQGIIKNIAGTTSLTGSIQTVGTDINPASASVSITADNTNDSLSIACTQPTGEFTGATGDSATDVITLAGHPFINGDEVCFSSLTGGAGLAVNTKYFVRDASGNTFKLTTSFVGNTAINFTTDITNATMDYIWYWHAIVKLSRINFGLY